MASAPEDRKSVVSSTSTEEFEKSGAEKRATALPKYTGADGEDVYVAPAETAKDLVTEVLSVSDDPSLSPWTFRVWLLGIGLSTFGGTLATIYYFKPQTVGVSTVFLAVISYVLGEAMAQVLPKKGFIGRILNPHPFNKKEHAAIVVMAASAANAPLAVEVLAVQNLFYDVTFSPIVGVLLIMASQFLGYGIAGLLRSTLVYPTKMLYPSNLPLNSLLENLHGEKEQAQKKLRLFYIGFAVLFVWEVFPEYIMPVLTGISVFCLAKRDSLVFTNIFGGSNGNEGLGFLSICLDWQYISTGSSPMAIPLQTLSNNLVGYLLCIVTFIGIYYTNTFNAKNFPFLSQLLFSDQSTATSFVQYNQTAVLNADKEVDLNLVAAQGLPFFSGSYAVFLLSTNLAITATFSHMMLWNYNDIKAAWEFAHPANLKKALDFKNWNMKFWQSEDKRAESKETDPHYRLMLAYKDVPQLWYTAILVVSILLGLIMLSATKATLPWWGFFVAVALACVCTLFFGAQFAMTGFAFGVQPVIQMIGGYLHPGKPVANMYFVLFGYNSVSQAQLLLRDLKFAQYAHLSPRSTFTMQMVGTVIGGIFSFVMMESITTNQREILLSIEGTNVWSGANVQSFNSQAIAWGGLAKNLFSVGGRYEWVTLAFLVGFAVPVPFWLIHRYAPKLRLDYWNTAIISYFIGWLVVGINSSILMYFAVGFFSQLYLRKYHPSWFIKYNYILSAALDGGTQVIVFILTFAVFGGGGKEVPFPPWFGNNFQNGNYDYCMTNPANTG